MPNASELPAEPGSGSEGSSTVESTSTTRKRSGRGLLCISMMHGLDNVLGRALKAGRRPYHHDRTRPLHRPGMSCHAAGGIMTSCAARKVRTQHPSKDSMPLAASERRSAAASTWRQLVGPAAAHETEESRAGLLGRGGTGAPRGPLKRRKHPAPHVLASMVRGWAGGGSIHHRVHLWSKHDPNICLRRQRL